MITLTLLTYVAPVALAVFGLLRFDRYTLRRYGHRFFSPIACLASFGLLVTFAYGFARLVADLAEHGNPLDGIVLTLGSLMAAVVAVRRNVRRTDVRIGLLGSLLQALLAPVGAVVAVIAVLAVAGVATAKPVIVLNRR